MRLAIADPTYPPIRAAHPRNDKPRASFWYGDAKLMGHGRKADNHPGAAEWDNPERHRALLEQLEAGYDGWAIATAHDGLSAYTDSNGELPRGCRVMIWHKPNSVATASRLRNVWEPVIIKLPVGRQSSRHMGGQIDDLLVATAPRVGFAGAKPLEWTRWVLACLGYNRETDTVEDLFPGSGGVTEALAQGDLFGGAA